MYRLRDTPRTLSEDEVKDMLRQHNFFDRGWHKYGDFENDFTDNRDGTVTDSVTGLMWEKGGSPEYIRFDRAQYYADSLNRKRFAGYSDWCLPTLEELASLLENKKKDGLFIDPVFDRKQRWCWSSDRGSSGRAWFVDFNYGRVSWRYLGSLYFCVRAVRS